MSICLNRLQKEISMPVRIFHPQSMKHVFALAKIYKATNAIQ